MMISLKEALSFQQFIIISLKLKQIFSKRKILLRGLEVAI